AFADLWGTEKLWVSMDRANLKPPVRPDKPQWDNKGFVHWDVDTGLKPIPFWAQGVLYLEDTAEDQGGFHCVPGFHKTFYWWVKTQAETRNTRNPHMTALTLKKVAGKAS